MKANELSCKDLMIGDWVKVKYPQKQVKVKEIKQSCIYTEGNGYEYSEIESIPLTPEILEKNGFIRDMFYGEWQFDLDTFPFNFPFSVVQRENNSWYLGREEIGIAHNREIIDISYVHELQHALRLCGIEKTIEL